MLNVFESLALTALVSESKDYNRYDLNAEKRITVKAWQQETLKRNFDIGKAAPSFRHTFVKIGDESRVFHASANCCNRPVFSVPRIAVRASALVEHSQEYGRDPASRRCRASSITKVCGQGIRRAQAQPARRGLTGAMTPKQGAGKSCAFFVSGPPEDAAPRRRLTLPAAAMLLAP